jgi:hypothetical protein
MQTSGGNPIWREKLSAAARLLGIRLARDPADGHGYDPEVFAVYAEAQHARDATKGSTFQADMTDLRARAGAMSDVVVGSLGGDDEVEAVADRLGGEGGEGGEGGTEGIDAPDGFSWLAVPYETVEATLVRALQFGNIALALEERTQGLSLTMDLVAEDASLGALMDDPEAPLKVLRANREFLIGTLKGLQALRARKEEMRGADAAGLDLGE